MIQNDRVESFLGEFFILKDLKHINILNILGVSTMNQKPCLLFPFMKNRDLRSHLQKNRQANELFSGF